MTNQITKPDTSIQATQSERFLNNVETQFAAEAGAPMAFTDYEKTLAQHLFLKVDNVLKDLETKRLNATNPYGTAYEWKNVNMRKMALDSVHRVKLGLDALIPNHIHPVPYFNKREGKYDVDLRVGYVGEAYYRIENAVDTPIDVIYELVYETDEFIPIKKSHKNKVESYDFTIKNPFNRGAIIGGFGYIVYENEIKNELVLVTETDFEKSRKTAQSDAFWSKHPAEMRFKTLVHRVTSKLKMDPKKINAASFAYVENQDQEDIVRREINENANSEILDFVAEEVEETKSIVVEPSTGEIINQEELEVIPNEPTQEGPGF